MTYQIGVIQFPGSNCERETKLALIRAQLNPVDIFWFDDLEKLKKCDGYVIVGGFSFEDRARSGVIASKDPMIKALINEAKMGKPILGICNGAQILVESGLVPGCVNDQGELQTVMALAHNRRIKDNKVVGTGFYNTWIDMQSDQSPMLHVPVAHAEGRFLMSDDLYDELKKSNVECWYYIGENPNNAYQNLAAVGNFSGNVLAMMPHPERTVDGNFVFDEMRKKIENKNQFQWVTQKNTFVKKPEVKTEKFAKHYFVKLNITDNEAVSVEMTLKQMGLSVGVKKYRFWGANADPKDLKAIENSYELWNAQKETVLSDLPKKENTQFLLVTDFGDTLATQKKERLNTASLSDLKTGIVWELSGSQDNITKAIDSHLLFNPVSQAAVTIT